MAVDSILNNTTINSSSALQDAAQSIINGTTGKSAFDVPSLVDVLVKAKTAGLTVAISSANQRNSDLTAAFGRLRNELTSLQKSLTSLSDGTLQQKFAIKASGKGLTAVTENGAAAGSYQVEVKQVANSQTLVSNQFDPKQKLGTGTMTLKVGDKSMDLDVTAENNTPAGIAAAINASQKNPGVTATVVNGTDGAHLVLRTVASGSANVINIDVKNVTGDNGLSKLAVQSVADSTGGPSTVVAGAHVWSQGKDSAAQDAVVSVGGITARNADNAMKDVIAGVTLNVTQEALGSTQTLTISPDIDAQAKVVTDFVTQYNSVMSTAAAYSAFDKSAPKGKQGGILLGDPTLNAIRNTLGRIMAGGVDNGTAKAGFAELGVKFAQPGSGLPEGSLVVDNAVLKNALQNKPAVVARVFNGTDGLGKQMSDQINQHIRDDGTKLTDKGTIAVRLAAIDTESQGLTKRQDQLDFYKTQLTTQYKSQFTALDALMAKMKTSGDFLTQMFNNGNK
jgi:flagellar hook-associated protein 2